MQEATLAAAPSIRRLHLFGADAYQLFPHLRPGNAGPRLDDPRPHDLKVMGMACEFADLYGAAEQVVLYVVVRHKLERLQYPLATWESYPFLDFRHEVAHAASPGQFLHISAKVSRLRAQLAPAEAEWFDAFLESWKAKHPCLRKAEGRAPRA